MHSTAVSD